MQLTTCLKALALASCFFFYSNASLADPTPATNCAVTTYTGTGSGSAMISNRDGRKYQNTESDTLECTTLDLNGNVGYIVDETMSYDSNGNPVAVYSSTDGSYTFSADTLSNKIIKSTFAINEALQQAGLTTQFRGFGYEWEVKKPDSSSNLILTVKIWGPSNNGTTGQTNGGDWQEGLIYSASYNYANQSFADWTGFDVDHPPPGFFTVEDDWYVEMTMEGNGEGSGVRGMKMTFAYAIREGADPFDPNYDYGAADDFAASCNSDPLSSDQCPGYQQAYTNQQCANDPLYDSSCSGYEQAYTNQQCANDPLYDSSCAGYEQAYTDQQCSQDPLYDSSCSGYQQAYTDQQCANDPLYDESCAGYQQAYTQQQCSQDPLYDSSCDGYEDAYEQQQFDEQCRMDAQSSNMCPGYIEPTPETYDDPSTQSSDGQDDGSDAGNPEPETFTGASDPVDQSTGMVDTNSGVDIQNTTGIDIEAATGVDLEATTGIDIEEQTGQQDFSEPPVPEETYEDPIVDVSSGEDVQATTGVDVEQSTGVDVEQSTGVVDTQEEFTEPVEIFTDPVEEFTEVETFTETVEVFEEPIVEEPIVEEPEAIVEETVEVVEAVEEIIDDEGTIEETDETTRIEESVEEQIEEEIVVEEETVESPVATVSKRSSVKTRALDIASAATTAAEQVASTQAQQSTQSSAGGYSTGNSADSTAQNTGSTGNSNTGDTGSSANNSGASQDTGQSTGQDTGQSNGNFANNSGAGSTGSTGSQSSFSTGGNSSMQNFSTGQTTLQQGDSGIAALNSGTSTEMLAGTGMSTVDVTGAADYGQTQESTYSFGGNIDATVAAEISSIIAAEINAFIIDMTKRALEEANQMGEPLDEVSPEDLLEQQQLEDELVAKALAGDESDEAQAALLGYNPNFRDYVQPQMKVEAQWYTSDGIYELQQNYDNPNQRFFNGASDVKHRAMVRQQYGEK